MLVEKTVPKFQYILLPTSPSCRKATYAGFWEMKSIYSQDERILHVKNSTAVIACRRKALQVVPSLRLCADFSFSRFDPRLRQMIYDQDWPPISSFCRRVTALGWSRRRSRVRLKQRWSLRWTSSTPSKQHRQPRKTKMPRLSAKGRGQALPRLDRGRHSSRQSVVHLACRIECKWNYCKA